MGRAHLGTRRRRTAAAGFSLIELTAAMAVLAIVATAVLASHVLSLELQKTNRETQTAAADLRAAMETILARPLSIVPATFPEGVPIAAWQGAHLTDESIVPDYPGWAAGPMPDPLEIVLTVTWTDHDRRTRSMSLTSLRAQ